MLTPAADVLIYAMTGENPAYAKAALKLLRSDHLLILKTVLCEVATTLKARYGLNAEQIQTALKTIAGLENATLEDAPAVELALLLQGPELDFVSALNLAQSRISVHYATFDEHVADFVRSRLDSPRVLLMPQGEQV